MLRTSMPFTTTGLTLALALVLGGCGKTKQNNAGQSAEEKTQAKQQKAACASPAAYSRLKDLLFDQAIGEHVGDRTNLEVLADYSSTRMEDPVVKGWDAALDVTQCTGRLILEIPPGAEQAFGGQRHLEAHVNYTAQAAADGNGLVYQLTGAEPIVVKLAAFNLTSVAYRPPPAIDEAQTGPVLAEQPTIAQADVLAPQPAARPSRAAPATPAVPVRADTRESLPPGRLSDGDLPQTRGQSPALAAGATGEATVRAFYNALHAGDGAAASAQVIPEKRSSRAFSPAAISRFYSGLREPIRPISIMPAGPRAYRVSYRYSAGRSRCNGSAVVRTTNRSGHQFIRSIQALNGC